MIVTWRQRTGGLGIRIGAADLANELTKSVAFVFIGLVKDLSTCR